MDSVLLDGLLPLLGGALCALGLWWPRRPRAGLRIRARARRRVALIVLAILPAPRRASRVRTAELEFATGLRAHEPNGWVNYCHRRRCSGVEIIQGEGIWCPLGIGALCWHQEDRDGSFVRRPSPAFEPRGHDDEDY